LGNLEKFLAQLAAVKATAIPFIVAVLFCAGLVYQAVDWRYSAIIANRDSEIVLLRSQRDDYKDELNGASPDQAKKQIEDLQQHHVVGDAH
jgi:hypothetical protein